MIITSSNGYKVSSKSVHLTPKNPLFKCPNCGCVYENVLDIKSCFDKKLATENQNPPLLCKECGTELVSFE